MGKERWLGDHVIIEMEYDGTCITEEVVRSSKFQKHLESRENYISVGIIIPILQIRKLKVV